MGRPPRSLQRTLALGLLAPLAFLVPLAAYLQYALVLQPTIAAFDHSLGDDALTLGNLLHVDAHGRPVLDVNAQTEQAMRTDQSDRMFYSVAAPDGALLAGDAALAALALPSLGGAIWGFADAEVERLPVRVASHAVVCGRGTCVVRRAETLNKRRRAGRDSLIAVALPMLLLAAGLLVSVGVAIRRALRPLAHLHDELARRSLDRLEPVDDRRPPLVAAVNGLFVRLRDASALQRTFIADAAHQLRTPLTVMRTEAELALLEPHPPALTPTLARLAATSERAARLAAQLLSLARAESSAHVEPRSAVDLARVARELADEWVPEADRRGADLGFELRAAVVRGRPSLLREMIANLVHNALEHAGAAPRVTVRVRPSGDAAFVEVEVEDDGPGIAAAERERVFRRFDRGAAPPGAGSGLGLAIVRDVALDHGGTVELLDPPEHPGLLVRVRLPRPAPH